MNEREKDRRLERGSPRFLVACGRGGIDAHRGTRVGKREEKRGEKGLGRRAALCCAASVLKTDPTAC
jgi:hypothetical protein